MANENKFLHLGNSNDKILYDKFKGKLEKKDIATNNKLLQIFNFFDKDGNGIIETANSKGVNEMQSLWNAVRTSATKNSNSIFEDSEAQEFLANSVDSTGKSLADNQVTASDLFAFLKALITPQSKQANGVKLEDLKPEDIVEYTPEEIEDISIQTVTVGVRQAREVFDAQKAQQGAVSDFVNETKETFDTEYASSRVDRYLMNEELCAQLLQRAKEDGLSEKEYLEAKIDLAMKLIQSLEKYSLRTEVTQDAINISLSFLTLGIADKKETKNSRELKAQKLELENLKTLLAKLSPEEINMLISKLLFIEENPKGNSNFDFSFGGKNNKAKPQTVTRYGVEGKYGHISPEEYEGEAAPNSLESLSKPYAIYKKMTFEEVFEKERGVQYNPEAIMDYSTKEAHLQFLVGMHNRNEAIKNILHDATVAVDANNKYGAPQHDAIETCNQNLANQIETAFRSLYSKNAAEAQRVIDEIMGQNSGIKVIADEQGNFIKLEFYGFKRNSLNLDLLGGTKPKGTTQESEVGFENNKFRMPVNAYSLVHLSKGLQQKLEDNYQTALKGKTLDDYSAEVKSAYQMAYGAENAEDMASAFVQSQQEGVQNTKAVVQGLGMVAMVAGQLIPVGGQAATALIVAKGAITYGGMLTSTLGSVGVSAVENYTKAGGPTEEDKKAMLQELGTSLALVGSGMGIGKGSEAIFRTLVMKNCPKLIAFAAEVGVDATASLLADYAITGQIDLSGEGIAQLQNILVGIIGAKGARNYLNTHATNSSTLSFNSIKEKLKNFDNPLSETDIPTLAVFIKECENPFELNELKSMLARATKNDPSNSQLRNVLNKLEQKLNNHYVEPITEVSTKIREYVEPLRKDADLFIEEVATEAGVEFQHRIKGDNNHISSLVNKIMKSWSRQGALANAVRTKDVATATSQVFDLYGGRLLAKDMSGINAIYESLYKRIESGEFIPEKIFNYVGKETEPYFSQKQMQNLKNLCDRLGYEDVVQGLDKGGIILYKDGYTSAHVNGRIKIVKDGQTSFMPTEIQIRTTNIQKTCDAIHLPYDIFVNPAKDILGDMPEAKRQRAKSTVEVFQSMNEEQQALYNKYQTDYIRALKENSAIIPKPSDYSENGYTLPDIISIEKLIEIEETK